MKRVSFTLAPEAGQRKVALLLRAEPLCAGEPRAARPAQPSPAQRRAAVVRAARGVAAAVCVAAAPAAPGLVPTQLCLQSCSFYRKQRISHFLPFSERLAALFFPSHSISGLTLELSAPPGLQTLPGPESLCPFVPSRLGAVCPLLPLLTPSPHLHSSQQPPLPHTLSAFSA